MKYLQYTYVDAVTGISTETEPAKNGPAMPAVDGLVFQWARESQYPTLTPGFFGTCPDDSFDMIDGVKQVLSQEDYEQMWRDEMSVRSVKTVSMAQARQQLLVLGVYDQVNSAISSMTQSAQIDWEYRTTVDRSYSLVAQMKELLGWSDAEMNTYFAEAAKL